jgi:hypothetical protein
VRGRVFALEYEGGGVGERESGRGRESPLQNGLYVALSSEALSHVLYTNSL